MSRISKEKRNQLIIVVLATLVVLGIIGFAVIRPQYAGLANIARTKKDELTKLQQIKDTIKKADDTANKLADTSYSLVQAENDVAFGDVFAWMNDTIRRFKVAYKVEIPTISQPTMGDVDLVPQFPYKQLKISVSGTAFYHDLGKFISDFENTFPHMRVINLTVEPASESGADGEKLSFRLDIVALVKSAS
jgi:Tfp pilus assembly protein PilO